MRGLFWFFCQIFAAVMPQLSLVPLACSQSPAQLPSVPNASAVIKAQSQSEMAVALGGKSAQDAVKLYQKLAVSGAPEAQNNLAVLYLYGDKRQNQAAIDLLDAAAANGFAPAEFNLGMLYETGFAVNQD